MEAISASRALRTGHRSSSGVFPVRSPREQTVFPGSDRDPRSPTAGTPGNRMWAYREELARIAPAGAAHPRLVHRKTKATGRPAASPTKASAPFGRRRCGRHSRCPESRQAGPTEGDARPRRKRRPPGGWSAPVFAATINVLYRPPTRHRRPPGADRPSARSACLRRSGCRRSARRAGLRRGSRRRCRP